MFLIGGKCANLNYIVIYLYYNFVVIQLVVITVSQRSSLRVFPHLEGS